MKKKYFILPIIACVVLTSCGKTEDDIDYTQVLAPAADTTLDTSSGTDSDSSETVTTVNPNAYKVYTTQGTKETTVEADLNNVVGPAEWEGRSCKFTVPDGWILIIDDDVLWLAEDNGEYEQGSYGEIRICTPSYTCYGSNDYTVDDETVAEAYQIFNANQLEETLKSRVESEQISDYDISYAYTGEDGYKYAEYTYTESGVTMQYISYTRPDCWRIEGFLDVTDENYSEFSNTMKELYESFDLSDIDYVP